MTHFWNPFRKPDGKDCSKKVLQEESPLLFTLPGPGWPGDVRFHLQS